MSLPANERRPRPLLGRALIVGFIGWFVPVAGNSAAAFVTGWAGNATWLAAPVIGVLASVITVLASLHAERRWFENRALENASPPRRRSGAVAGVLVSLVLVLGVGGWAVAATARYAVGWISGDESGIERLASLPKPSQSRGLTLTVTSIQETTHFTRVKVSVTNEVGNSLTLPLFNNCVLTSNDRTTLQADSFKSEWADRFAPGASQAGTITFASHLPATARTATLRFATVFEEGFNGPKSISVPGMPIKAAANG